MLAARSTALGLTWHTKEELTDGLRVEHLCNGARDALVEVLDPALLEVVRLVALALLVLLVRRDLCKVRRARGHKQVSREGEGEGECASENAPLPASARAR